MSVLSDLAEVILRDAPTSIWQNVVVPKYNAWGGKKFEAGGWQKYSTRGRLNTREAIHTLNTAAARTVIGIDEGQEESAISDTAIAEAYLQAVKEERPFADDTVSGDYYRYGGTDITGATVLLPRSTQPFFKKPAALKIVRSGDVGGDTPLLPKYTKFFLQSVQEAHFERYQIIETFNDFYVFLFGEKPPIYNFSGTLINSEDINWLQDFMLLYEGFFRGTRCVENNARAVITFENRQMEGYILNITNQTQADVSEGVPFSFQMVITRRTYLGLSLDFDVITKSGQNMSISLLENVINELANKEGKGSSNNFISTAYNDALESLSGSGDSIKFKDNPDEYQAGQLIT